MATTYTAVIPTLYSFLVNTVQLWLLLLKTTQTYSNPCLLHSEGQHSQTQVFLL